MKAGEDDLLQRVGCAASLTMWPKYGMIRSGWSTPLPTSPVTGISLFPSLLDSAVLMPLLAINAAGVATAPCLAPTPPQAQISTALSTMHKLDPIITNVFI